MTQSSLTLIDDHCILQRVVPNTFMFAGVAALAAEPATIDELELALTRYIKVPSGSQIISALRGCIRDDSQLDFAILDLRNRIVASTGALSQTGYVNYHEFLTPTNLRFPYLISDDWLFTDSIVGYESLREQCERATTRTSLDTRAVLYGPALLHFISDECNRAPTLQTQPRTHLESIKSGWLSRCRDDLAGKSPRQVLLEKRDFIDTDLNVREWQWRIQRFIPACLPANSSAYRYAGFGSIECLVYCEMLDYLILAALENASSHKTAAEFDSTVQWLADLQTRWLTTSDSNHGDRIPAKVIDGERKRLPLVCAANAQPDK